MTREELKKQCIESASGEPDKVNSDTGKEKLDGDSDT